MSLPWPSPTTNPYYQPPGYYPSTGSAGHVDNSLALIAAMNRLAAALEKLNERNFVAPEKDPA